MKILFINPSWDGYISRRGHRVNRAWTPLDLLICAAILEREGVSVDLIDARAEWQSPESIAEKSQKYDKVFITSSPLDRWQCPNLELDVFFDRVKPIHHPELYVMGVHGTQYPEEILRKTGAKAVIRGEPEWTVRDIVLGKPLADIQGLTYREGDHLVSTAPRPLTDLTQLPIPAFHLVNLDHYEYELLGDRFVILEATRGCPYPCTFCQREIFGGKAYRYKTPEQIAREVEAAVVKAGARTGYFIDLELSLNREFTLKLCQALMPYRDRWTWCCQTRADAVDPELLQKMYEAGCRLIHFGVETGSEKIAKQLDKRITLARIAEGVAMTQKAGIEVACFLLAGFPGETQDDREKTFEFAKKMNPTYVSFHIASPYPGTPLYAATKGDQLYPESVFEGKELEQLKAWQKDAVRRYYLRPSYMLSRLGQGHLGRLFKQFQLFQGLS